MYFSVCLLGKSVFKCGMELYLLILCKLYHTFISLWLGKHQQRFLIIGPQYQSIFMASFRHLWKILKNQVSISFTPFIIYIENCGEQILKFLKKKITLFCDMRIEKYVRSMINTPLFFIKKKWPLIIIQVFHMWEML